MSVKELLLTFSVLMGRQIATSALISVLILERVFSDLSGRPSWLEASFSLLVGRFWKSPRMQVFLTGTCRVPCQS